MCALKGEWGAKRQMGRHKGIWGAKKANVGAKRQMGRHKGICVAIKADGVPLRQIWALRKALGRREACGAP